MMDTCDYGGCNEPIRDEDKDLRPETKKYCQKHGAEIDNILKAESPAEIMKWWAKSMIGEGNRA